MTGRWQERHSFNVVEGFNSRSAIGDTDGEWGAADDLQGQTSLKYETIKEIEVFFCVCIFHFV